MLDYVQQYPLMITKETAPNPSIVALRSYKTDFSNEEFEAELLRVTAATAIEREWIKDLEPFATDHAISVAAEAGELLSVQPQPGLLPIQRLLDYEPERSNPTHPYHYSPPYLRPEAAYAATFIARAWFELRREAGDTFSFLALTSAIRSIDYQEGLSRRAERVVAIDTKDGLSSSHSYGLAFDIDGCGIYRFDSTTQKVESINPRKTNYIAHRAEIGQGRDELRGILSWLNEQGVINFVEEVPGTQEWCFHICVNPHASAQAKQLL